MLRQIAAVVIGVLVAVTAIYALFDVRGTRGLVELAAELTDSDTLRTRWQ